MRYLAMLSDANLSGQIGFKVESINEAVDVAERRGTWMYLPRREDEGQVLLSDSVSMYLYPVAMGYSWSPDEGFQPPEGAAPSHIIDVGPRGGIRVRRDY